MNLLNLKNQNIIKEFHPYFIVKYTDGTYGLYDTKSEMTADNGLAQEKAEYLYHFCKLHGSKKKGGLKKVRYANHRI